MLNRKKVYRSGLCAIGLISLSVGAQAQVGPVTNQPQQVVPQFGEVGAGVFVAPVAPPASGTGGLPGAGTGTSGSSGGGAVYSGGSAMQDMMATAYGQTAVTTAGQLGENSNAVAAFGQIESGFRNVNDSLGTTQATGPWQVVPGTWAYTVARYNLPYTAADITNPSAQAVVAPYIIKDYADQLQNNLGTTPTISQTYGSYLFGPKYAPVLAQANSNEPLSAVVPPTEAANNNMSNWTVGMYNSYVSSKFGSVGGQPVFSSGGVTGA